MVAASSITVAALMLGAATAGCIRPVCGPPAARSMSSRTVAAVSFEEVADAPAPRCRPEVPLVTSTEGSMRGYTIVSRIAVRCATLTPEDCDDTLRARACAVGADAVVLDDTLDTTPQRKIVNGTLVRWNP